MQKSYQEIEQAKATVVICTKGRVHLLEALLHSISQLADRSAFAWLVIENSACQDRKLWDLTKRFSFCDYHYEPKVGLSTARNTGIQLARSEWVIYIDDDTILPENFLTVFNEVIGAYDFDCLGGMYYPVYLEPKPKWLPDSFGTKSQLRSTTGMLNVTTDGFLSGGIFAMKRQVLLAVGGFSPTYGMSNHIGYGEEDELQLRLQAQGYRIGFAPDWWLYHAVLPHKYALSWHLKSAFARGRDGEKVHQKWSAVFALYALVKGSGGVVYRAFKHLFALLRTGNTYYWENYLLDVLVPFLTVLGRSYEALRKQE